MKKIQAKLISETSGGLCKRELVYQLAEPASVVEYIRRKSHCGELQITEQTTRVDLIRIEERGGGMVDSYFITYLSSVDRQKTIRRSRPFKTLEAAFEWFGLEPVSEFSVSLKERVKRFISKINKFIGKLRIARSKL